MSSIHENITAGDASSSDLPSPSTMLPSGSTRRGLGRTPQACETCRRRKSKCDGARPRCKRCAAKNLACEYPNRLPSPSPAPAPALATVARLADSSPAAVSVLKPCLDIFFERHFMVDFCSFDYRPDFEAKCAREPALSAAVIALCSRYLQPHQAQALFDLESGREVCKQHLPIARSLAKESMDRPCVSNIQANLILGKAELLSNSGSRHWLFAGAAIRMAEIMRLNKDFHQVHGLREQEVRRRTFWACLLLDRSLAYFLAKHRTIDIDNVGVPVPGTDISMAYQEESRGLLLETLDGSQRPSDLGLIPFLIKTVCVWSDLADFAIYSRRRLDKFPPTDPRSMFQQRHAGLQQWAASLHPTLAWNTENLCIQAEFGQGKAFVAMHFLLRSAACVAHQGYLPHLTMYTNLVDAVDAAGFSYLHRHQPLIDVCVENALVLGKLLASLMDAEPQVGRDLLQTTWVASSILIIANTLLWLEYSHDEAYSDAETLGQVKLYSALIYELISSWVPEWKAAKQWLLALHVMHNLYKAAYLGEVDESILSPGTLDVSYSDDDECGSDYRPRPGDGYAPLVSLPNLQASVKFATGDTSARSIDVLSIWLQLSGGWSYGFIAQDGSLPPSDANS